MSRLRQNAERRTQNDAQAVRMRMFSRNPQSAFTLVELLVVILIISILSGLVLGVAAVAAESGREARTKQMISRLHTLLMEHYDTYRNRRVEIRATGLQGTALAVERLRAAREQMKMEMPDRWSDIVLRDVSAGLPDTNQYGAPRHLNNVPSLTQIYRRRFNQMVQSGTATVENVSDNQSAECLYLTIMYATGDGEARALFKESDIADTDGDGAPEFVDGWGLPIQFLRWAPGYVSETQLSKERFRQIVKDEIGETYNESSPSSGQMDVVRSAINSDRDPLDLFAVDRPFDSQNPFSPPTGNNSENDLRGYRLMPLIYSAGRDESYGIRQDGGFVNFNSDPYYFDTDTGTSGENQLGDSLDSTSTDNITNHLITAE